VERERERRERGEREERDRRERGERGERERERESMYTCECRKWIETINIGLHTYVKTNHEALLRHFINAIQTIT
jgi:hypothetical protein